MHFLMVEAVFTVYRPWGLENRLGNWALVDVSPVSSADT